VRTYNHAFVQTQRLRAYNNQAKVERGEAKLGDKKVDVLPPDPIGELGSGWEKIQKEKAEKGLVLPVVR